MKTPIFLMLLLALAVSKGITAQNNPGEKILITGAIFDKETNEPLPNAYFSVNSQTGYVANELGRFLFKGNPGDKITYSHLGYTNFEIAIPDTLKSLEYLVGVFMTKDTIMIPEVVIFPRTTGSSIITKPEVNQQMLDQAQANVDKAVIQGLTQPVKAYDAEMNARQTMRIYQMKAQNKGMLATTENSVGVSTQSYRNYNLLYGAPVVSARKVNGEIITQTETEILIGQYQAGKEKMEPPVER